MPNVADSWKEYNTAKKGGILKSPYNFINPPNQVYETPWNTNKLKNRFGDSNGLPSHSKPFADAICGTLEIDWTFETPFLIGGADDGNSPVKYGEDYVLPGASIRGMLRNVLEIATAARVCHMDREARFSFRDVTNGSSVAELWLSSINPKNIMGGYLKPPNKNDPLNGQKPEFEGWTLFPSKFARIDQKMAAKALGGNFAGLEEEYPNARFKNFGDEIFTPIPCRVDRRLNHVNDNFTSPFLEAIPVSEFPLSANSPKAIDENSPQCHGQITPVGFGKDNTSWIFHYNPHVEGIPVPPKVMQRFIQAHSGITGGRGALDYWSELFQNRDAVQNRQMRVVFHCNNYARVVQICEDEKPDDADEQIKPQEFIISLSRMIKAPHEYSVGEVAEKSAPPFQSSQEGTLDFIQALFGHVPADGTTPQESKPLTQAWKGRVFFRHGELSKPIKDTTSLIRRGATESPRASFAPYYLRPKTIMNQNEMLHWSRENIRLAGRKRYPIREGLSKFPIGSEGNTHDMNFINSGLGTPNDEISFRSKIKIHNLHPIELGGLIWAIGFCNLGEENTPWRHAMGRGKPQGYGRVRGSIVKDLPKLKTNKGEEVNLNSFSEQFETWLCEQAKDAADNDIKDINDIDHIAELRALANPKIGETIAKDGMLEYPNDHDDSIKGHNAIKKAAVECNENNQPALQLWRYPKSQRGDS